MSSLHVLPRAEDLGRGHWTGILKKAGVDPSYLSGRSGPCPFCGGTDRFQWRENKHGGVYLCRACTEARYRSGMDLLARHLGSFREAADFVREHFNVQAPKDRCLPIAAPRPAPAVTSTIDVEAARSRMQKLWSGSRPVTAGDPVDRYLRRRIPALAEIPAQIHYHPRLAYYDPPQEPGGAFVLVGYFPAMLVRGFDRHGQLVQLHKTYLTQDGHKADVANCKKTDRGVGCNSFALRLQDPVGHTLGVCEGIETALAAAVLSGTPVWPCHSAGILANFELPEHLHGQVKRLVIYADSDEIKNGRRAGSHAASQLASRVRKQGLRTLIVRPAKVGTDMADLALQAA